MEVKPRRVMPSKALWELPLRRACLVAPKDSKVRLTMSG